MTAAISSRIRADADARFDQVIDYGLGVGLDNPGADRAVAKEVLTSWWCELGAGAAIPVVRRFPTARLQLSAHRMAASRWAMSRSGMLTRSASGAAPKESGVGVPLRTHGTSLDIA
jgi:hypothetical protein